MANRSMSKNFNIPASRPTISSASRASINDQHSSKVTESRKPSSSSGSSKPFTANQKSSYPASKAVLTKDKDWTKEKVIQTRSRQTLNANVEFYENKLRSKPGGHLIEEMLKWEKDHNKLERNHRYIQWLFPLPGSRGKNPSSQPLQEHEAEKISSTRSLKQRVLRAYKMMLDFYGMELEATDTGQVRRAKNWKSRFSHLNMSFHNYLRITRILKSLSCLGYPHLPYPWLHFILTETLIKKTLPNLDCSAVNHWISALPTEDEQKSIREFYKASKHGELPLEEDMDIQDSEDDG